MPQALLIDDEPPARATLRQMLSVHTEITVAGEAATLETARTLLGSANYDIVFLDVQLRGGTGFDLVPSVRPGARIVFVTGYDKHAVRAFEVNALDYLVKPLHPARLAECVGRILARSHETAAVPEAPTSRDTLGPEDTAYVKTGPGTMRFVSLPAIVVIRSADNYSEISLANGEHFLTRQTLSQWETMLPGTHFMRVQRQTIVNVGRIEGFAHQDRDLTLLRVAGSAEPLRARREDWPELRGRIGRLRPGNIPLE